MNKKLDRTVLSLILGAAITVALAFLFFHMAVIRPILAIPLGLIIGLAFAVILSQLITYTPPILGADGKPLPGSVVVMEKVKLDGRNEWVILRGYDRTKPVLFFVSGGPVGSELGWVRHYNADLEKDFVVAVWEEPGGGKSYPAVNYRTVKVEDYINDGLELTRWLRTRFNQEKIFLVGHSWGTLLTVWMVQRHPEYYRALVNVGQMTNIVENDRLGYQMSLDAARKANDAKIVAKLEKNGLPPYGRKGAFKYTGYMDNPYGPNTQMVKESRKNDYDIHGWSLGYNIPEYGLLDRAYWYLGLLNGMNYIYSPLLDQVDLIAQVTKLNVPVYLATGRHDYNAWFELTEKYYAVLKAPKKELIWFEDSGHNLNFTEPEKFMDLIRRVLAEN